MAAHPHVVFRDGPSGRRPVLVAGPEVVDVVGEEVLALGAAEGRAVVTENVRDVAVLASSWVADDRPHAGIVFTHPRRFARAGAAYPGTVVTSLRAPMADPPVEGDSWTWWLD